MVFCRIARFRRCDRILRPVAVPHGVGLQDFQRPTLPHMAACGIFQPHASRHSRSRRSILHRQYAPACGIGRHTASARHLPRASGHTADIPYILPSVACSHNTILLRRLCHSFLHGMRADADIQRPYHHRSIARHHIAMVDTARLRLISLLPTSICRLSQAFSVPSVRDPHCCYLSQ